MSEALKRYKKFHGKAPTKISTVSIPYPKKLVLVGEGVAVEYRSDKPLGNRPKRKRVYRHPFGRGVKVYMDPKGKALYITGGKFRVTDWLRG